jgi:hypothetical protein
MVVLGLDPSLEGCMKELQSSEIFQILAPGWEKAISEQRYDDAIQGAHLGYRTFRDKNDEVFGKASLIYLKQAIDEALKRADDKSPEPADSQSTCSFCGRAQPISKLVAGPSAHICGSCASTANDALNSKS